MPTTNDIASFYAGQTPITKLYSGETEIWGGGGSSLPSPSAPPVFVAANNIVNFGTGGAAVPLPAGTSNGDMVVFVGHLEINGGPTITANNNAVIFEQWSSPETSSLMYAGWYEYAGSTISINFGGDTCLVSNIASISYTNAGAPMSLEGFGAISNSFTDADRFQDPMPQGEGGAYWRIANSQLLRSESNFAAEGVNGDPNWSLVLAAGTGDDGSVTDSSDWSVGEDLPLVTYSTLSGTDNLVSMMAATGKGLTADTQFACTDFATLSCAAIAIAVPGI